MEGLQDFTDTGQVWMQYQQKSSCGKSTHNNFNCSMYYPLSHGVS